MNAVWCVSVSAFSLECLVIVFIVFGCAISGLPFLSVSSVNICNLLGIKSLVAWAYCQTWLLVKYTPNDHGVVNAGTGVHELISAVAKWIPSSKLLSQAKLEF